MATSPFDSYSQKRQQLVDQLISGHQHSDAPLALQKSTSNLFRHRKTSSRRMDVRHFNQVLVIDAVKGYAEVEGMITYADFVAATLPHGVMPAVVPELKSITVGGALSGVGIESSSFRYGLVHESILEFDVLLGDGRVVTCRADNEHRDLYFSFPNSYGTLGYAIRIKVKLIPTKPYVKLTHYHFTNSVEYYRCLQAVSNEATTDFVDAVIFSQNQLVVTVGTFVNEAPYASDYKYQNIYYRSIAERREDYLTIEDYIWRWDADWFWCSKVFGMQNHWMRLLLGRWMLKSTVYMKLMRLFKRNKLLKKIVDSFSLPAESVIQDVVIPIESAVNFLNFFEESIGIKPIWNCPVISRLGEQFCLFPLRANQLYINFGFWDMVPSLYEDGYYNRLIERKVAELGGLKSLYSNVFYTEEEFWQIYNREAYQALKKIYDPKGLLGDLYQKCSEKLL